MYILGKGFAEVVLLFAEYFGHSAIKRIPVVYVYHKPKDIYFCSFFFTRLLLLSSKVGPFLLGVPQNRLDLGDKKFI